MVQAIFSKEGSIPWGDDAQAHFWPKLAKMMTPWEGLGVGCPGAEGPMIFFIHSGSGNFWAEMVKIMTISDGGG